MANKPSPHTLLHGWPEPNWLPVNVSSEGLVQWANFEGVSLDVPFFEDAIRAARFRNGRNDGTVEQSLEALIAGYSIDHPPVGLIYHMSRCGSTLLGRMLSALPETLVISEPPAFDALLDWIALNDVPHKTAIEALRAMAAALGRGAPQERYFLKLDAWHVRDLPLLRQAFPNSPWVYLFREPSAVVRSHLRQPGRHVVPNLLTRALPMAATDSQEVAIEKALTAIQHNVINHWHVGGGLAVDYADLVAPDCASVLQHFHIAADAAAMHSMADAMKYDAKQPQLRFQAGVENGIGTRNRYDRLNQMHARLKSLSKA